MEAYKFKTKVSENGTIIIPDGVDVKNKEVEVIILIETEQNITQKSHLKISNKFTRRLTEHPSSYNTFQIPTDFFKKHN